MSKLLLCGYSIKAWSFVFVGLLYPWHTEPRREWMPVTLTMKKPQLGPVLILNLFLEGLCAALIISHSENPRVTQFSDTYSLTTMSQAFIWTPEQPCYGKFWIFMRRGQTHTPGCLVTFLRSLGQSAVNLWFLLVCFYFEAGFYTVSQVGLKLMMAQPT